MRAVASKTGVVRGFVLGVVASQLFVILFQGSRKLGWVDVAPPDMLTAGGNVQISPSIQGEDSLTGGASADGESDIQQKQKGFREGGGGGGGGGPYLNTWAVSSTACDAGHVEAAKIAAESLAALHPRMARGLQEDIAAWNGMKINYTLAVEFATKHKNKVGFFKLHQGKMQCIAGLCYHEDFRDTIHALSVVATEIAFLGLPPTFIVINGWDEPMAEFDCGQKKFLSRWHGIFSYYKQGEAFNLDLPVWSRTKISGCHRDILYPISEMLWRFVENYDPEKVVKWEDKVPVAFWRGCPTGFGTLETNHRMRLVQAVRQYEEAEDQGKPRVEFDVGLHKLCQNFENDTGLERLMAGHVSFGDFGKHKYILDVDGNTYSRRMMALMLTGSVVVRMGFFTDIMVRTLDAGRHYVRASMDMSDMIPDVEMLNENDAWAKQIAEDGRDFFMQHFRHQDLMAYLKALVLVYHLNVEWYGAPREPGSRPQSAVT